MFQTAITGIVFLFLLLLASSDAGCAWVLPWIGVPFLVIAAALVLMVRRVRWGCLLAAGLCGSIVIDHAFALLLNWNRLQEFGIVLLVVRIVFFGAFTSHYLGAYVAMRKVLRNPGT